MLCRYHQELSPARRTKLKTKKKRQYIISKITDIEKRYAGDTFVFSTKLNLPRSHSGLTEQG